LLKNRILAGWIIAFTIGVGIGLYFNGYIRIALFATIGVLCGVMIAAHRFYTYDLKKVATICMITILGMAYSAIYTVFVFSGSGEYVDKEDTLTAKVTDIGIYAEGGYYDISVKKSDLGLGKGTGVRLYYTEVFKETNTGRTISIKRGDTLSCTVKYNKHNSNRLYSKNIYVIAEGSIDSVITGSGFFYNLREKSEEVTDNLFKDYTDEVGAISKTLIVGETADMDSYVYELFRNGGVSHLLVISGLHITIIVMSLYGLLEFFTVRRQLRSVICLFVLIAYAFFVGFSPSVSRAVIMTGIMLLCMLATRRADSITSLFLALFILLLINPFNLFSIGLGLSFLSCLGILILSPYIMRPVNGRAIKIKKVLRILLTPLIYTLAASIFTFPILLAFSNSVSYISPLINLFITPLYTYLLIILIPCITLFAVIGSGEVVLAFIPGKIITYSYQLLDRLYESDTGSFSSYIPYMILPLLFALAAILALCLLRRRKMFIALGIFSLCFMASITFCIINFKIQSDKSIITVLNDSYTYKSLFIADESENIYFELGGKRSNISTVYKHGYCRLDYYVMNDVTGTDIVKLESALAQINIKTIYIPDKGQDKIDLYKKIKLLANRHNCDIIKFDTTLFDNIGNATVIVKNKRDNALSASFIATISKSGQSIRVYGGKPIDSITEYGYSSVVIILESFDSTDYNMKSDYRCIKLSDENNTNDKTSYLYDKYLQILLKNKAIEVDLNEP